MFSGGETVYIPTIPASTPPAAGPGATRRPGLRRTVLDKTLASSIFDTESGGHALERNADRMHQISWNWVYKGYDPKTGMFLGTRKPPADPGITALISDPRERVVAQDTIETPADYVLVRVMVFTLFVQVSPKLTWFPLPELTYGGYVMHRRREYFYGPGHPQQKVQVNEQVIIRKPDGTIETKPVKVTYADQPRSLEF